MGLASVGAGMLDAGLSLVSELGCWLAAFWDCVVCRLSSTWLGVVTDYAFSMGVCALFWGSSLVG